MAKFKQQLQAIGFGYDWATHRSDNDANGDGFGVVVQAYGRRAGAVIDWLHSHAEVLNVDPSRVAVAVGRTA